MTNALFREKKEIHINHIGVQNRTNIHCFYFDPLINHQWQQKV